MRRAIIFANGRMDEPPAIVDELQGEDLVIAADGGTYHCRSLGITPGVIIGDFDSLSREELESYRQAGIESIAYPSQKDETDLELALLLAQERGASEVYIIGALGARWDMSLANILLAAQQGFAAMKIHLVDGKLEMQILRGREQAEIHGRRGETVSLIPLAGDARGITTHGLEYPLKDETLHFGSSRGVSNVFVHDLANVEIDEGVLLCIFSRGEE